MEIKALTLHVVAVDWERRAANVACALSYGIRCFSSSLYWLISVLECNKTCHFETKIQKFSGEGAQPTHSPSGKRDTPPTPHPSTPTAHRTLNPINSIYHKKLTSRWDRRTLRVNYYYYYCLDHVKVVELYHPYTHFLHNVRLSHRRIVTFSAHCDFFDYCAL